MRAKKSIMTIDPEKRIYGDYIYGTEFVQLSAPIIILKTDTVAGNLVLTPLTSVTYNWDLDGMQDPDLVGPILDFGYNFTLGKVNWMGNFRLHCKALLSRTGLSVLLLKGIPPFQFLHFF